MSFLKTVAVAGIACIALLVGCNTAHVEVTVINSGATTLHNIEFDYPSASFGVPLLAPGAEIRHKVRLTDTGRMKADFFDSRHTKHSGNGPFAAEGQRGTLILTLDGTGRFAWDANLKPTVTAPKNQ